LELSDETGLVRLDQTQGFVATGASITVRGGATVPDQGQTWFLLAGCVVLLGLLRRSAKSIAV
jgi:hypothetical protein